MHAVCILAYYLGFYSPLVHKRQNFHCAGAGVNSFSVPHRNPKRIKAAQKMLRFHNDSERDEDELGSKAELRKFKAGRSLEGSGRALLMTDTALLTYARVGECEGTLDRSCNGKLHPKQVPVDDVQHKMSHWKDIYLQLGRL